MRFLSGKVAVPGLRKHRRIPLFLALLLVGTVAAQGFALESVDINAGLLWRGTYQGSAPIVAAPSPLLNTIGVSLPIRFAGVLLFTPELRVYGTQYGLVPGTSRAVPVEVEYAHSVWMLNLVLQPALGLDLPLGGPISLGLYVAPVFLGRIPLAAWGDGAAQREQIAGYFYESGRYFLAAGGFSFTWAVYDNLRLLTRVETHVPVFHFWDGEDLPFYDQMTMTVTAGLRFMLGGSGETGAIR